MDYAFYRFFRDLFLERPRLGIVVYGTFTLIAGGFFIHSTQDALQYLRTPERMSFEQAEVRLSSGKQKIYASIRGLEWQCSGAIREYDVPVIPLTDESKRNLVAYYAPGSLDCGEGSKNPEIRGMLAKADARRFEWFQKFLPAARPYARANVYILLEQKGALWGVAVTGGIFLFMGFVTWLFVSEISRRK